ncbi:MAG: ABC transporter permease [Polyangiales bacterium]
MGRYLLRRCLSSVPTLFGVTLLSFVLLRAAHRDPLLSRQTDARVAPQALVQLRAFFDLDQPWPVQYARLVQRLVTLDLGNRWQDGRPIRDVLAEALPITLGLTCAAITLAYLIAVPLGVFSAVRRGSLLERTLGVAVFMLYSLPGFWLGTLLLVFLASGQFLRCPGLPSAGCFPLQGWHSFSGFERMSPLAQLRDIVWHAILPVATLTYPALAAISRFTRAGMLDVLRQDYVRTARSKGLSERAVVFGHALRNSLLPLVTLLALELPRLIGGSVIVESIFGIRGMGLVALEAIRLPDYPLVITIVTLTALCTLSGSLFADVLYALLDPRLRERKV